MQIMIDTETEPAHRLRAIGSFLLTLSGCTAVIEDPKRTSDNPHVAKEPTTGSISVASAARPVSMEGGVPAGTFAPPPPPPPAAPEAPPAPLAQAPLPSAQLSADPSSNTSLIQSSNESLEYDAAGFPWDARIHQKGKGLKKDKTWKLQKGIDQALVQSVVTELASKRRPGNTPSAPPSPGETSPEQMRQNAADVAARIAAASGNPPPPPPPPPSAVEAPPPPAPDVPGAITYRQLTDKIIAGTKAGAFTTMQVMAIIQSCGAPNIQALNGMAHLIPEVNSKIELALLGL